MIKIEMDVRAAATVRESLFQDTKEYTYDPKCCPQRVVEIRDVINKIDEQIETQLKEAMESETTDS